MDLGTRKHLFEQERGDIGEVAVTPNADDLAAVMRDRLKARDRVHADAHQLRERGDVRINALGELDQTIGAELIEFLHEAVRGAAAELARSKVVFGDIVILFTGDVGHHDDAVAGQKAEGAVINNLSDALVDQRHRELFFEHLDIARALIVALVGVTDGQVGRAHDHALCDVKVAESDFKPARRAQAVDCIDHSVSSSKSERAIFKS